jgi:DNA-binding transcriptional ArsR family regulator
MGKLNPLLHQELRLSVVSFLAGVESADFNKLLEVTSASKGNLSVQLTKLKEAGYIEIEKSFRGNYPHTECRITPTGQEALEEYIAQLKSMLDL